jgi:Scramblase
MKARLPPLSHFHTVPIPRPPASIRALRNRPSSAIPSSPSNGTNNKKLSFSPTKRSLSTKSHNETSTPASPPPSVSSTLAATNAEENNLLAPVYIPEDPNAVLKSSHPSTSLLAQSGLVVQRQIEMMNLFIGFEQANRYVIMDPQGNHVGYMAEHDGGIGKTMTRQWFKTHRAFTTNVFDRSGTEVLRVRRSWNLRSPLIKL